MSCNRPGLLIDGHLSRHRQRTERQEREKNEKNEMSEKERERERVKANVDKC